MVKKVRNMIVAMVTMGLVTMSSAGLSLYLMNMPAQAQTQQVSAHSCFLNPVVPALSEDVRCTIQIIFLIGMGLVLPMSWYVLRGLTDETVKQ